VNFRLQIGKIVWAAPRREWLDVFFDDGQHYRYTTTGLSVERNLPDTFLPIALAGDLSADRLIALVPGWLAAKIKPSSARLFAEGNPDDLPTTTQTAPASRPAKDDKGFWLATYSGRNWQPWVAAPAEMASPPHRASIAVTGDRVHLFWSASDHEAALQHAVFTDGQWDPVVRIGKDWPGQWRQVIVADPQSTHQLVIVLSQPAAQPNEFQLRLAVLNGESWTVGEPVRSAEGVRTFNSENAVTLAAMDETLVLFERMPKGRVNYVPLALTGETTEPDKPIAAFEPQAEPAVPRSIGEPLSFILLVVVLGIVMWRRQETLVEIIPLPAGTMLASLGSRMVAGLLDLLPAVAVTAPMWWPLVQDKEFDWSNAAQPGLWPMRLYIIWLVIRVIYVIYSFSFEWWTGRTPGKRVARVFVLNRDQQRPTLKQCAIRNAARLLELEPLLQVFPVLIIVIVTRNHQRLGDILADTVVVQRGLLQARPVDRPPTDSPPVNEPADDLDDGDTDDPPQGDTP